MGHSSGSASSATKLGMGMPLALFWDDNDGMPLACVGPELDKLGPFVGAAGIDLEAGCDCDLRELPAADIPASAAALDLCELRLNSADDPAVVEGVDGYVPYSDWAWLGEKYCCPWNGTP